VLLDIAGSATYIVTDAKHLFLKHGIRFNKKAAEFYLRCLCSVSEPLAAQQSNAPAIPNDNKIITTIKTTTF